MSGHKFVPVIGLVGGVGSGKSAVAGWVAANRNVAVIDGDLAGHQVLNRSDVKQQILGRFGEAVFDEDGEVNRSDLGRLVFGKSDESRLERADLEQIVHPGIRESIARQIEEFRSGGNVEGILLDAAVLFEAGWDNLCDAVVFVDAPYQQRLNRVVEHRGWTEENLISRESSQLSISNKRSNVDAVVDNSGTVADAGQQLEQVLEQIVHNQH